jgi:hypothetical protein
MDLIPSSGEEEGRGEGEGEQSPQTQLFWDGNKPSSGGHKVLETSGVAELPATSQGLGSVEIVISSLLHILFKLYFDTEKLLT